MIGPKKESQGDCEGSEPHPRAIGNKQHADCRGKAEVSYVSDGDGDSNLHVYLLDKRL